MAPAYKLTYFNVRARAELTRLIFSYAGVDFEDVRVSGDWSEVKAKAPFGQLPILEVDGVVIGQSMSIARFVAKRHGLAGANELESALADMYVDGIQDLLNASIPALFEKDEAKKVQSIATYIAEKLVPYINRIEKHLSTNGGQYLVGKSFTWADLAHMNFLSSWVERMPGLLNGAPLLKQLIQSVSEVPNIKKWLEIRPKTSM